MKNVSAATQFFTTGPADLAATYTVVFDGTWNATDNGTRIIELVLTPPFVRTAGSNLQIKFERLDNAAHPGYAFVTANGNQSNSLGTSARRVNTNTLPTTAEVP
jgi:hypothetical protein